MSGDRGSPRHGDATDQVTIDVHLPPGGPLSGMAADVRAGPHRARSRSSRRSTSTTSAARELFEQITELPEYYPTRASARSSSSGRAEIVAAAGDPATLIELGSGSAAKTRVPARRDARRRLPATPTCPVDISEEITRETAERLVDEYDGLDVHGLVCDFELHLERIPRRAARG